MYIKCLAHRKYSIMDSFNFYFPTHLLLDGLFYPFSQKSSEAGNSTEVLGRGTPRTLRGGWQPLGGYLWGSCGLGSGGGHSAPAGLAGPSGRGEHTGSSSDESDKRGLCSDTVSCIAMYRQVHYGWTSCWRPRRDRLDWPSGASAAIGFPE